MTSFLYPSKYYSDVSEISSRILQTEYVASLFRHKECHKLRINKATVCVRSLFHCFISVSDSDTLKYDRERSTFYDLIWLLPLSSDLFSQDINTVSIITQLRNTDFMSTACECVVGIMQALPYRCI